MDRHCWRVHYLETRYYYTRSSHETPSEEKIKRRQSISMLSEWTNEHQEAEESSADT